jgi:glycosyltransferase involved in cell wall biosynthesis
MRIAFSARGLSIRSGGVHQLIRSLVPALAQQIENDELVVIYNHDRFLGLAPNCSEIVIKGSNRIIWDFIRFPKILHKLNIDAAIFPKNIIPFFINCPSYAIIHDLAYFDRKLNAYPFLDTIYMRTMIPNSVRRAAGIFAVSENTKKDIVHYTNCDPQKITVTYEAADKIYRPINETSLLRAVRQKYKLPDNFILYVGSLSPRKNIIRLLNAFSQVRQKISHNLVLTGSKSWEDSPVYNTMNQLNLGDRINQLGYVEPEDMPVLYNLACAYVYPSLYEGFGLPVLEAMQCGCPVIASKATSIPEVAGDAAILVDPLDTTAITQAIYKVVSDSKLRRKLVSAGLRQAKKFSWERCADTMLKIIRRSFVKTRP